MGPILGLGDHPPFLHNPDVEKCISTHCGSCNGAGKIRLGFLMNGHELRNGMVEH